MEEHKSHCPSCAYVQMVANGAGGYEKVSRAAVIDAECARFRAFFMAAFRAEMKHREEAFEQDLETLEDEALNFALANAMAVAPTTTKTGRKRSVR